MALEEDFLQPIFSLVDNDDIDSIVELGLTKDEKTSLIKRACEMGSLNTLKMLLKQVDPRECEENLLLLAMQKERLNVLKELCSKVTWWEKDKIDSAYTYAKKSQSYSMINFLFYLTGYWSNS